jgi:hypothetical protein
MTTLSWLEDEPRLVECFRQAGRLLSRGVKRPVRVLIGSAIFALGIFAFFALESRSFSARYVLRVVEPERDPNEAPRPRRQLAEYVGQGVFTSGPLTNIIHRYGLYPSLARKNMRAALDAFREDIEVETYRNYFIEERSGSSEPRSARLAISYKNRNQDVAVAVTRELGALVVEHERSMRHEQAARAEDSARREVEARRMLMEARRLDVASRQAEAERKGIRDPELEVESVMLAESANALALRQDVAEKREADLAVGTALEWRGLGMSFDVVNDASLPTRSERDDTDLVLAGASLVFGLPLVVMAVGAFDQKRGRV